MPRSTLADHAQGNPPSSSAAGSDLYLSDGNGSGSVFFHTYGYASGFSYFGARVSGVLMAFPIGGSVLPAFTRALHGVDDRQRDRRRRRRAGRDAAGEWAGARQRQRRLRRRRHGNGQRQQQDLGAMVDLHWRGDLSGSPRLSRTRYFSII